MADTMWTDLFYGKASRTLTANFGSWSNGAPFTSVPFASELLSTLEDAGGDYRRASVTVSQGAAGPTVSKQKDVLFPAAEFAQTLAQGGMAIGNFEPIASLPPDIQAVLKAKSGIFYKADTAAGQPAAFYLTADGSLLFWQAVQHLTLMLDSWKNLTIDHNTADEVVRAATAVLSVPGRFAEAAMAAVDKAADLPGKAVSLFGLALDIATSPVTWAVIGGGLILHYMGEEAKKPSKK